jgi:uncharacterized cofD-like protein
MIDHRFAHENAELFAALSKPYLAPFDLVGQDSFSEKLVNLVLSGPPPVVDAHTRLLLAEVAERIRKTVVADTKVVVFGGGTGLSNVLGGDSRQGWWVTHPFAGIKAVFPRTTAIVCVTDDGGATGELLKDLPIIGIGDIRHVLLSSIQKNLLMQRYDLGEDSARQCVEALAYLFNFRFTKPPESIDSLLQGGVVTGDYLPAQIHTYLGGLLHFLRTDSRFKKTLSRPHCLGNLLICAAMYQALPGDVFTNTSLDHIHRYEREILDGLAGCAEIIGAPPQAVMPSCLIQAQLRFRYTNGVEVRGESKSASARRGFPVDRVFVDFAGKPIAPAHLLEIISAAEIILFAPGSLYSSIIPVLQVPAIVEKLRENRRALKLLVANIWVQSGETDRSVLDPDRKFHVSDLIRAYERNVPGGIGSLVDRILCLNLSDVPASIIENYALEDKIPIYLDRDVLTRQGFATIAAPIFSEKAMRERHVIQHDPGKVADAVKTLFLTRKLDRIDSAAVDKSVVCQSQPAQTGLRFIEHSARKYRTITDWVNRLPIVSAYDTGPLSGSTIRHTLVDIIWKHQDISYSHLRNIAGVCCVEENQWNRDQRWDRVFSFYDPADRLVKIRRDRFFDPTHLEIAFLITVGQALLGNYADKKSLSPIFHEGLQTGLIYQLWLVTADQRNCFLTDNDLRYYLRLARMVEQHPTHFTRIINGEEGFTPPGLLMGLLYAWYLDNRFAHHIEYKMSVLTVPKSDLIPELMKTREGRRRLIDFFRDKIFAQNKVR